MGAPGRRVLKSSKLPQNMLRRVGARSAQAMAQCWIGTTPSIRPASRPVASAMLQRRRRLIYRSKQRGWLELDIVLGGWSEANLKRMNSEELDEFQNILDLENPDLFKWLTLQEPVPEELQGPVFAQLLEHVNQELDIADDATRTTE